MSAREARKARNREEKTVKEEKKDSDATATFSLSYYFCCLCLLPKRFRKAKRRAQQQLQSAIPVDAEVIPEQTIVSKDDKTIAAIKIQSVMRGFQGRQAMKEYWRMAIEEESAYWLAIIRARELAWLEKERRIVARKQFVLQYVEDVFSTSMAFFNQTSEASTEIQRRWRGHRVRSNMPIPPPPAPPPKKPRRPPPKVVPKSRFTAAMLRRVWSRRDFQPKNGKWLHTTDFGHLEYDMWEYIEQPPAGNEQGMRINKVRAVARNERERDALTRDQHAWVGLPIGIETWEEFRLKQKEAEPENVVRLKSKSPYNARVVNFDKIEGTDKKDKSKSKGNKNKQRAKSPSTHKRTKAAGAASSGSERDHGTSSGSDREGEGNTSADSDVEVLRRREFSPSPNKPNRAGRALNEENFVKELMKYGYDPETMDPVVGRGLARLGTVMYDLHTGRQIVHKGNNRWVGTNDKSFVVQYELPPKAIVDMEKNALNIDDDSYSASVTANPFGDYNLRSVKPRIVQHRSGAVTVTNPALLNKKSRFLRDHRAMFLDNYTHHNLSDYSGLLSSTYFDLALQGVRLPQGFGSVGDNSSVEDDVTDFNYIQSQSPSQSQAQAYAQPGFKQSFLTDSAASLAQYKSDSKVFPSFGGPGALATAGVLGMSTADGSLMTAGGSAVRYTAAGNPIRGARKPHTESAFNSTAPGRARKKAARTYDNISESYKGQAGSAMNNERYAREGSKKFMIPTPMASEKSNRTFTLQDGMDGNSWKSSAWGKVKKGVEDMSAAVAQDPALRSKLYRAATNASIASSSVGFENDDLDFTAGQRSNQHQDAGNSDYDSDEDMWRSRSVYKAGKDAIKGAKVWPKKPQINYKLRYTWIPQPLVHNAVNNLYYEKTVWDYRKESTTNNPYDFKKEIKEGKESFQKKLEKSSMLSLVDESNTSSGNARRPLSASDRDASPPRRETISAKSGLVSPSEASVSSSKYYKNFVGEGTAGLRDGWDTYQGDSPSNKMQYGDSKLGLGPGVMITSLMDADSSIGSLSDEEGSHPSGVDATPTRRKPQSDNLRQQVLRKGMSFTLRSGDGKSANFVVQSPGGSSVGSNTPGKNSPLRGGTTKGRQTIATMSPSPSGKGADSNQLPQKESYFKFPSPTPSSGNLHSLAQRQQDFDLASGLSSPGASVSAAGGGSGVGSSAPSVAGDAWDATSATPTGAFLSVKATSKSGAAGKLLTHKEDESDEFALGHSASYFGAKPAELSADHHAGAMLVEKRGTSSKDIKANHYLNKKIRETAHEMPVSSDHLVLQPPPPEDAKRVTTHAPKFKFKPTPPAAAPPPDSYAADAAAANNASYPSVSKKVKLPPEVQIAPSISQRGASFGGTDAGTSDNGTSQKGTSVKRLGKGDNIHPYHFL